MLWAASVGVGAALASVAFREGIRGVQWLLTGQQGGLVHTALALPLWQRALTPMLGGIAAGAILYSGRRWFVRGRAVDYMEAVAVGNGEIAARPTLVRCLSSLLTIGSGGSIGREGPMVQLAALLGSRIALLSRTPVPRRRLLGNLCTGSHGRRIRCAACHLPLVVPRRRRERRLLHSELRSLTAGNGS